MSTVLQLDHVAIGEEVVYGYSLAGLSRGVAPYACAVDSARQGLVDGTGEVLDRGPYFEPHAVCLFRRLTGGLSEDGLVST